MPSAHRFSLLIGYIVVIFVIFTCSPGICSIKYTSEQTLTNQQASISLFDSNGILLADPFVTEHCKFLQLPFGIDKNGILYYEYGERYNNLGNYHNPTFVASYANALYYEVLLGKKNFTVDFLKQVDYLLSVAKEDSDGGLYWPYPFENIHFKVSKGWYSAMTSGRILGVLIRAHVLSGNDKYLAAAQKVYKKLEKPLKKLGMTTYGWYKEAWLEEVASPEIGSFKVLNGHIFALAGLHDYAHYTNDKKAQCLTQKAINAIRNHLEDYDAGFISYYSEKMPSRTKSYAEKHGYHALHIYQLLYCYLIDGDSRFLKKAMRFQLYENFSPDITATFTTNLTTNGTEKMNLTFGNNYWSSFRFPVSLTMDLKEKVNINEITIIGHSEESSPKSFLLYKSDDSLTWDMVRGYTTRKEGSIQNISFKKPINVRYLKYEICSSNSGKTVALDGIGIHRNQKDLYPVFIQRNRYRSVNRGNYNLKISRLFDNNNDTMVTLEPNDDVELIIPCRRKEIQINGDWGRADGNFTIFYSVNLKSWKLYPPNKVFCSDNIIRLPGDTGFIKIRIQTNSIFRISELYY